MARGEITGRKPRVSADHVERSGPPIQPMAYSIRTFCELHDISVDTYFRMQRRGEGPVTMKVGGRTLISQEAAAAWRRASVSWQLKTRAVSARLRRQSRSPPHDARTPYDPLGTSHLAVLHN